MVFVNILTYLKLVLFSVMPFVSLFNSVVEFKDEEFVRKAIETMNKHDLSGRPLNIKEVIQKWLNNRKYGITTAYFDIQ